MSSAPLNDFGDRLNPFLVKELRQSLRSPVFVIAMLWVQASMTLIIGLRLINDDAGISNFYYWANIVFMLHLVVPFRTSLAGDEDRRVENFELLAITPNSNDRLMLSKWSSTGALTVLLVLTLMPYHLVRYFSGGVDVARELLALIGLALTGAVYGLWAMFASTFGGVTRMILLVIIFPLIVIIDTVGLGMSLSGQGRVEDWIALGTVFLIIGIVSLGVTSSRFDYDFMRSEQHSTYSSTSRYPQRTPLHYP